LIGADLSVIKKKGENNKLFEKTRAHQSLVLRDNAAHKLVILVQESQQFTWHEIAVEHASGRSTRQSSLPCIARQRWMFFFYRAKAVDSLLGRSDVGTALAFNVSTSALRLKLNTFFVSVPKKRLKRKSKCVKLLTWWKESESNRKNKIKFGGIKALLYYKIK